MGDYTGLTVHVKAPKEYLDGPVRDIVESYYGDMTKNRVSDTEMAWEGGDVRVGSADDLDRNLRDLAKFGDEGYELPRAPFAFKLWEDPKYEWLGDLYVYVSQEDGDPLTYTAVCDADGQPCLSVDPLVKIVAAAATLDDARIGIELYAGTQALAAFEDFEAQPLPQQLEIEA